METGIYLGWQNRFRYDWKLTPTEANTAPRIPPSEQFSSQVDQWREFNVLR